MWAEQQIDHSSPFKCADHAFIVVSLCHCCYLFMILCNMNINKLKINLYILIFHRSASRFKNNYKIVSLANSQINSIDINSTESSVVQFGIIRHRIRIILIILYWCHPGY